MPGKYDEAKVRLLVSYLSPIEKQMIRDGSLDPAQAGAKYGIDIRATQITPTPQPSNEPVSEEPTQQGFLGAAVDAAQGTAQQFLGQAAQYSADNPISEQGLGEVVARGGIIPYALDFLMPDAARKAMQENTTEFNKVVLPAAAANQQEVEAYRAREGLGQGFDGGLRGIGLDIASNPDQVLGLAGALVSKRGGIGTVVGESMVAVPVSRVYLTEYYNGLNNGLTKEQAKARAAAHASIEFATEHVGGKYGIAAKKAVTSVISKIGRAVAGEAGEEIAAEFMQGELDTLIGKLALEGSDLQKFGEQQGFKSFEDGVLRTAYAGTVGAASGGLVRTATAKAETSEEIKNALREAYRQGAVTHAQMLEKTAEIASRTVRSPEIIAQEQTLFDESKKIKAGEVEAAYRQKLDQEQSVRDSGFDQAEQTFGTPADVRIPTPEVAKVIQERAKEVSEIDARRQQLTAQQDEVDQTNLKKALAKRTSDRARLRDSLITEGKPTDDIRKALVKFDKETAIPTIDTIKQARLKKENENRIAAEKIAAKEVEAEAKKVAKTQAKPEAKIEDAMKSVELKSEIPDSEEISDTEINTIADDMRKLGAKAPPPVPVKGVPASKGLPLKKKGTPSKNLDELIKKQAKVTSVDDANALLSAAKAGKVVIMPTGTQIPGRDKALSSNGFFDGKTMYVAQEAIDSGYSWVDIAKHEADHLFKYADNVDHETVKKYFASATDEAPLVRTAAANGNPVAKRAVERATKAAASNSSILDVETTAYFAEEAAKANRAGGLGSIGTVFRRLVSKAKDSYIGELTGQKLDVIKDQDYIATKRLEKAGDVKTKKDRELESLGGVKGKGFTAAKDKGRTFTGPDGKERYYFSDAESYINAQAVDDLKEGQEVYLSDIYHHEELFNNYPALEGLRFELKNLGIGVIAQADGETGKITFNSKYRLKRRTLLTSIVHEVQHMIQAVEGFSRGSDTSEFYNKTAHDGLMDVIITKIAPAAETSQLLDAVAVAHGYTNIQQMEQDRSNWADTPAKKAYDNARALTRVIRDTKDNKAVRYSKSTRKYVEHLLSSGAVDIKSLPDISSELFYLEELRKEAHKAYMATEGEVEARFAEHTLEAERLGVLDPEEVDKEFAAFIKMSTDESGLIKTPPAYLGEAAKTRMKTFDDIELESRAEIPATGSRKATLEFLNKVMDSATNAVTSTGGLGRSFREMRERAASWPTEWQLAAEAYFNDLSRALRQARRSNPQFNWDEFWSKLENEEDAGKRELIVNAMSREFPEVAKTYNQFRSSIDQFSDRIVYERAKTLDTHPLTKQEAAIYKKILANKGRYTMRNYLLTFGKRGEVFGKRTYEGYKIAKKRKEQGHRVSPKEQKAYDRVTTAMEYLRKELDIPQELPDNLTKLRQLYGEWFTPTGEETAEEIQQALSDKRSQLNPEEIDSQLGRIVRQILGVDEIAAGGFAARIRGLARDNTIVTAREQVPEELRNLMGEVTDQPHKLMLTLTAQANFVARTKFLSEVSNDPNLVIPKDQINKEGNQGYTVPLEGPQWGPLQGYYAKPKVADMLKEVIVPTLDFETAASMAATKPSLAAKIAASAIWRRWGQTTGFTKAMTVLGSPINFVWNIVGNPLNLSRQGNFNPKYSHRAYKVAKNLITKATADSLTADTRSTLRAGVTDSAQIGELKGDALRILEDKIYGETLSGPHDLFLKKVKDSVAALREIYAMTDVVSKIANYLYYKDQLTDFYEAEGIPKTEEQIEREAADKVSDDNITYKRALPAAKVIEQMGATMFAPYIADTFRSQMWNLIHGFQELNRARTASTPAGKAKMVEMGTRRIAGTMAAYTALTVGLQALADVGDEDKDDKWWKKLLPDYAQVGHPIYIGTDKDGNEMFVTLSRVDPWGPVLDVVRSSMNGTLEDGEDIKRVVLDNYVKPRFGTAVFDALTKISGDSTSYDREEAINKVLQTLVPSWFKNANTTQAEYPQGMGAREVAADVFKLFGGRLDVANPGKITTRTVADFEQFQRTARKEMYQTLTREDNLSTQEFTSKLQDLHEREVKKFNEMVDVDQALVGIGKTPKERVALFKNAGLSEAMIAAVMRGVDLNSTTTLLSKDSIIRSLQGEIPKLKGEEKERYVRNLQQNAKKLKELGLEIN